MRTLTLFPLPPIDTPSNKIGRHVVPFKDLAPDEYAALEQRQKDRDFVVTLVAQNSLGPPREPLSAAQKFILIIENEVPGYRAYQKLIPQDQREDPEVRKKWIDYFTNNGTLDQTVRSINEKMIRHIEADDERTSMVTLFHAYREVLNDPLSEFSPFNDRLSKDRLSKLLTFDERLSELSMLDNRLFPFPHTPRVNTNNLSTRQNKAAVKLWQLCLEHFWNPLATDGEHRFCGLNREERINRARAKGSH